VKGAKTAPIPDQVRGRLVQDGALADGRHISAQARGPTGFDQRCRAKVDSAGDMGEDANRCNDERANQPDHDDFQVGGAISAVHRMVHAILPCQTADGRIDLDQTDIVAQSP
jgi:hypothetical protein